MCRLSENLAASTSWNPKGLSTPVMGLLYLYLYRKKFLNTMKETLSEKETSERSETHTHSYFRSMGSVATISIFTSLQRNAGRPVL
jgi:hypothetical protein